MSDYSQIIAQMRASHALRIKRWRKSMSGKAWRVYYHDGRIANWIEAPFPRTPLSLSIFLHEVGHHAIGFDRFSRRCEEEFHVWEWALAEMRRHDIEPDARVLLRVERSMQYAVDKAQRRGIKALPEVLQRYARPAA